MSNTAYCPLCGKQVETSEFMGSTVYLCDQHGDKIGFYCEGQNLVPVPDKYLKVFEEFLETLPGE